LNKNSPHAHTKSEFDVLGVAGKLVKYVVFLFKRKIEKNNIFLFIRCPNSKRPGFGFKEF
jgi:hypothetical protein